MQRNYKKCKFCFLNLHNCEIITTFAVAKDAYGHFELYIDIQAQSVTPLNKRYKPRLDFLKTGHFQEIKTTQVRFMHAHAFSVSFPCVDLSCLGSPEPQKIKLSERKSHAFIVYIRKK